ncbi:MAG: serine/threonine-protein phosphatase [Spirochaetales bacterium]|nr:MAG: serine/threonine-protein phosphatase [Spirochaetales bacterium]
MLNSCDDPVRETILSLLGSMKGFLLALNGNDTILGVLPECEILPGLSAKRMVGKPLIGALGGDFVRIFDGKNGWDEIGYFADGTGARQPWHVRRFDAAGCGFVGLFPEAIRFLMASPLTAYGSLEEIHEKSIADHTRELEAMNLKLRRRSRRLKQAINILEARNKQNINEMNLAVELQKSLLPKSYPDTDLISFTHRYIPLAMVGGDFFDIVKLSEDRIGVMISDVSGHGVAPAFITAMLRSSFDYLVPKETSPATVIARLNEEFSKIIDTDHFVTAFYAIFDFSTMTCHYCNAGHPAQLIGHQDGTFTELTPENPIIGMLESYDYQDSEAPFMYGDVLCFFTDGIMESRNAAGVLFGAEGIKRSMTAAINGSVDDMADRLITDIIEYMKDPVFEDDITILFGQVLDSL